MSIDLPLVDLSLDEKRRLPIGQRARQPVLVREAGLNQVQLAQELFEVRSLNDLNRRMGTLARLFVRTVLTERTGKSAHPPQKSRRHEIANSQLQRTQPIEATDALKRGDRQRHGRLLRLANHRRHVARELFRSRLQIRFVNVRDNGDSANRCRFRRDNTQPSGGLHRCFVRRTQFQHHQHVRRDQFAQL